jgi:hypothetical protein
MGLQMLETFTWGTGFLMHKCKYPSTVFKIKHERDYQCGVGEIIYNEGIGKIASIGMGEIKSVF